MIVKLIVMRKIFLFVILLCWGIVGFTQDGVNFEHLKALRRHWIKPRQRISWCLWIVILLGVVLVGT